MEVRGKMGKKITIIVFLLFIYGFFTFSLLKEEVAYSETENRTLAKKPEFSGESFFNGSYTKNYENYIQDQFPLRDEFVSLKNYAELVSGKRELKGILMCDDGYMIENHKEADYKSERAVKNARAIVSGGNRWSERLGNGHVSVMIVPNTQTILRDKLPEHAQVYNQTEYINTIKDGLKDGVFVDVSDVLKEHDDEYIYYKTDHHWTTYGAYLAYTKWCGDKNLTPYKQSDFNIERATEEFLGTIHSKLNIKTSPDVIEIYNVKDYNIKAVYNMGASVSDSLTDKSFLEGKDKYGVFMGGNQGIVEITEANKETVSDKRLEGNINEDKSESVLLIIKDSYANCFVPMTAGMYDRIYVIDLRYFNMKIDTFMEMYGVTDVLLMYNADTLTDDVYVSRIGY